MFFKSFDDLKEIEVYCELDSDNQPLLRDLPEKQEYPDVEKFRIITDDFDINLRFFKNLFPKAEIEHTKMY